MNSIGTRFRFTSFGESHGTAIGGIIDGVPARTIIDREYIKSQLSRRSGNGAAGTSRRAAAEKDELEWLGGVIEKDGLLIALGSPIAFAIRNTDARSEDYDDMQDILRPGHADYTYEQKYGIRDIRGGGRASARETAARVVAGSIAQQILKEKGVEIKAELSQVGNEKDPKRFDDIITQTLAAKDSIGGIVSCTITGIPVGVGEPIFDKLQARLAYAVMSINGCKGFEYGTGFEGVNIKGSDIYHIDEIPCPASGGIEGGISNGLPVSFRCVFKPTATIAALYKGRHDACIAIRAVPVVEAMTAITLSDMVL